MSLKQKRTLSIVVMVIGIVPMMFGVGSGGERQILFWIGMAVFFVGIGINVLLVRCPHCGAWLGRYPGENCATCGKKINDPKE